MTEKIDDVYQDNDGNDDHGKDRGGIVWVLLGNFIRKMPLMCENSHKCNFHPTD